MIILAVHNSYQQPGGEDEVFRQETRLLEQHGHRVIRYQAHNHDVNGKGRIELLAKTVFNSEVYRQVRSLIERTRPDVMHVHNTFPLLSPAVYYAAKDQAVPVVQTLHNYRLLCPTGLLFREGHVCESCLGRLSLAPAIARGCYRDSRPATAAASAMLLLHRGLNTYKDLVTSYIALSELVRSKCVAAGLPSHKVFLKPNCLDPDPGVGEGGGEFCLFVGRLSNEKGISPLLDAWTRFRPPLDLEIVGDGELAQNVAHAVDRCPRIRWQGRLQKPQVYERLRRAAAVIVPSIWYEPAELASLVRRCVGYKGEIVFERSKPDGTPRKLLDISKLRSLGWQHSIPLEDGIRATYEWFVNNVNSLPLAGPVAQSCAGS
jgi:glycosyltransferase involved in cell wall biosynthesis